MCNTLRLPSIVLKINTHCQRTVAYASKLDAIILEASIHVFDSMCLLPPHAFFSLPTHIHASLPTILLHRLSLTSHIRAFVCWCKHFTFCNPYLHTCLYVPRSCRRQLKMELVFASKIEECWAFLRKRASECPKMHLLSDWWALIRLQESLGMLRVFQFFKMFSLFSYSYSFLSYVKHSWGLASSNLCTMSLLASRSSNPEVRIRSKSLSSLPLFLHFNTKE